MSDFFRFPHTPHIAWLGQGMPRDDKVLDPGEARALLAGPVVVEEKLDGANLGFSVGPAGELRAQNRGQYLLTPYLGQFSQLGRWLALHEERLFAALGEELIAFGEWCAARHTLDYSTLPDWWLLFDIYDRRQGRFWSTRRRDQWAAGLGLAVVPAVCRGQLDMAALEEKVRSGRSRYRQGGIEGVVVRREDEDWLLGRAKLVHADFTQAITDHWRRRGIEWNRLRPEGRV